uniref:Poly [ADP-ribose] polymerase n=2 Tax=Xiphophorus couchianus TaxID=32473 RepID=A0A3B5MAT0_9TELE
MLNSSLLLLEVPADTNTSLPVWDALRSLKVGVTWTVKPYGISINITPLTVKQEDITASCERENTSSVAETSSLQPQIQNTSCALLTFFHNSLPTLPHTYQPNQSLVNPISVSLPLIITHSPQGYQPGTMATIKLPPAVQAPTSVSGDLDVEPKKPNLSSFHTKVSHDILICDNFLLGTCDAGVKCKMHHTPYPFHWQLRSIKTHQWIDLSPRAQVLLERSYCCAEQSNDLSALLLKKMSEKELKFFFNIGVQKYEVDFTNMTQTRIISGYQRQICCRPAYRSPESMYPHLKSGIQSDFANCDPNAAAANFTIDPLQEFSSWYPPVWLQGSEEDYRLVDVPAGTQAYRSIKKFFHENLPETKIDIISLQQIQNLLHWDKYQRQKTHMQKHTKAEGPLERHLFHGTRKVASESICLHGFDPRVAGLNGHSHGFGSYFATNALMSHEYTEANESDEVGYMFLAKVLVGRVCLGKHYYRRPPNTKVSLYDACVDNKQSPRMFIVFDNCQCYPYYLIKYKKLSEEINIHD